MPESQAAGDHQPDAGAIRMNLGQRGASLLDEARSSVNGRAAMTLAKTGALRLTLLALKSGAVIKEHHASDPLSIHLLSGETEIAIAEQEYHLTAGEALVLEAEVMHGVRAVTDSIILLTLAVTQ